MAKEISLSYIASSNLYAVVLTATGQYVNGTTPEAFNASHWGSYAVALTEYSAATGQYSADFPALAAGVYTVDVYLRAGGSPALTDGPPVAVGLLQWDGSVEVTLASRSTYSGGAVASVTAGVTVTTNNDKTGYSLSVTPPTAAQVATAVWQDATAGDFTTTGSIGKSLFTGGAAPGAANGLFIAGTNAATTITTALTTTFTGNLTGSVGSVSGGVTVTTNNDKTGYALSVTPPTAAQVATAVWQDATAGDFTAVGSIGKSLFTSGAVPGAAGGLFIAGTNAATTITTALTTTFTGNLTGSVGSVSGGVTVTTNNDKTGYSLSVTPPTAAQVATAVWQDATAGDFTTTGSIGKSLFTSGIAPGSAGGHFIAGTNAATTITTAFTTTFTGDLTGNVGGNVTGSVGSVASGVTVTTNNDKTGYSLSTAPPTASAVAAAVWRDAVAGDFTVTGSIGKSLFTGGIVPGAANGLFIAGTNAATTITTALTTTFTGDLTGDVGGNVVGSVGSVTAGVDVAQFGGHNVVLDANNYPGVNVVDIKGTVSAGSAGHMGPDWAQIANPTSTVGLTNTTINSSQAVGSVASGVTVTTNNDKTGYSLSVAPPTAAQVATAVWQDTTLNDFTVIGSPGKVIAAQLGGAFTTTSSSIFSTAALANAPAGGSGGSTAAQIATAVWQDATSSDFTVDGSIGKSLFTGGAAPGAAGGHFVAGTNAATTITTALTTTFTGNLTGSVGSVAGGVTVTTNNDKTGYSLSVAPPTAAQVATAVWQDTTAGDFTTVGSPGKVIASQLGGAFSTTSSSVFSSTALANAPTGGGASAAQIATAVWQDATSSDFTAAGSIGKSLFTGGTAPGASGGLVVGGSGGLVSLAPAGLDGIVVETGVNGRQALALILDTCLGQISGAATPAITVKTPSGLATRAVVSVDANSNRTAVALSPPV